MKWIESDNIKIVKLDHYFGVVFLISVDAKFVCLKCNKQTGILFSLDEIAPEAYCSKCWKNLGMRGRVDEGTSLEN